MADITAQDQGSTRTVTLNRPEARNALDSAMVAGLAAALRDAEAADGVSVIVLTGADPAFCAGLDLNELAETGGNADLDANGNPWALLGEMTTPVIGAINGPAVTGGFELALQCDFLVASERASFADTHARVGAMPGGGMMALLPRAVGLAKALELSLTGSFVDAAEAKRIGLVNHVVPHDELIPTATAIAAEIANGDPAVVRALKQGYSDSVGGTLEEAVELEQRLFRSWNIDGERVAQRRRGIIERGRGQTS